MSQFPNGFNPSQGYYGQARPGMGLSTTANGASTPGTPTPMMTGVRPGMAGYGSPTASPTPSRPTPFNIASLASLTDAQRQALLAAQQRGQLAGNSNSARMLQQLQQQRIAAQQAAVRQHQLQQGQSSLPTTISPSTYQQFMHAANQSPSVTPAQLQQPPMGQIRPQLLHQQSQPPRPPNPTFNPALLNTARAVPTIAPADSTMTPLPPSNTVRPTMPVTQAFAPALDGKPRSESPVKAESKPDVDIQDEEERKKEEEKRIKKEKKAAKRKAKEEEAKAEQEAAERAKAKEKAEGDAKPKKPKPPRTQEEKDKRAEARRRKAAADREKREAANAANTVFFSAPEPTAKDTPPTVDNREVREDTANRDRDATAKSTADARSLDQPRTVAVSGPTNVPEARSRRHEGMRGSMRNEIARLMYGAGDVAEPDIDTVDYMEDMVTEFLADLCRPVQPMRPNPNNISSSAQLVPLGFDIVRHRLSSTAHMEKYVERFDHMVYMSDVLKAHRRIANPNLNDLVETVGNDYLGLDDQPGGAVAGQKRQAEDGEEKQKKRGRVQRPPGEKRKPGPQKGWKQNRDPNAPPSRRPAGPRDPNAPKRKYNRRPGAAPPGGRLKTEV
ncbi:hypothetical protein IAU60_003897 [Kwoniella sp. DSM 27419]